MPILPVVHLPLFMNFLVKASILITTLSVGLSGTLRAAEESTKASSVPEPSIALLGGLCGIFFLLWRKK
ncbi:hypothetical protein V2O64_12345 [Verrucomicrobiaceae bacterium 227]